MSEEPAIANTPPPRLRVFRSASGQDIFRIEIDNGTSSTSVLHFPLNKVQAVVAVPPMNVQILARKIIDIAQSGIDLSDRVTESETPYILQDALERITDLCSEQLQKEDGNAK